jgi:ankyrin repeat protein
MALLEQLLPSMKKKPENMTGNELVEYLIRNPKAKGTFCFSGLRSPAWCRLLSHRPEFIAQCNTAKIRQDCAAKIIIAQPQLLPYFPPDRIDWRDVLLKRPELIDKMPKGCSFTKSSWVRILRFQPGLWDHSPKDFSSEQWSEIIDCQPQLADKCPWKKMYFSVHYSSWIKCLFKYPDLILSHRPDWKQYYDRKILAASREIADILCCNPEIEKLVDFSVFDSGDWEMILKKQPQFIKYCDVKKIFTGSISLRLIAARPELVKHFDLDKIHFHHFWGFGGQELEFVRSHPQLADKVLHCLNQEEWVALLYDYPEYLVNREGWQYSFQNNTQAFVAADFWDFERTGLDSICNMVYTRIGKSVASPEGLFRDAWGNEISPADFLVKRAMDPFNAKNYFFLKLRQGDWDFIAGINDIDPEIFSSFIKSEDLPFLWSAAAPQRVLDKLLDQVPDPAACRDRNGNTLLHAALVGAVFDDVRSLSNTDNPYRARYDSLLKRGCDPDRKNNFGVSCSDLLSFIREKVSCSAKITSPERLSGPDLANYLIDHPEAEGDFKWDTLQPGMWKNLLIASPRVPDFISFCPLEKFTGTDWCELIRTRKEFADLCRWETFTGQDWRMLLLEDNSYAGKCDWSRLSPDDWAALLHKDGSYIARLKLEYLRKPEDLKAIMEAFYLGDCPPGEGPFNENLKDLLPFLILRPMDRTNAGLFLKRQYADQNWDFIRALCERSPEEAADVPGKDSLPFFIALSAPDEIYRLFFQTADLNLRDSRGNSLLLPALVYSLCAGSMDRYHDMLSKGCDPNQKNNSGISCNDLIKQFTHTKG